MMEFILSRASACICGAMIIALLFAPMVSHYEDMAADDNSENCETIGRMMDSFMDSVADESMVDLGILLPDSQTVISFSDRTITMENEYGIWHYNMRHDVEADSESYGHGDFILLTKNGDALRVTYL